MPMLKRYLIVLLILCPLFTFSQERSYTLSLKPEDWGIQPGAFYICGVDDKRHDTKSNGKILMDGSKNPIEVLFENDIQKSLFSWITNCMPADTSKIPIWLAIDDFKFKDPGTALKHTLSLDFKIHFYRILEGQEVDLYQTSGTPQMQARGFPKSMPETILRQTFKSLFQNFNEWVNQNPAQIPLCKKIAVEFVRMDASERESKKDTIRWTSEYRLIWSDFKSAPDKSSPFSAQSHCLFDYKGVPIFRDQTMILQISIFACFAKKESWVHPDKKEAPLLTHEQLHFDICELFVRKLRKKISETPLSLLNSDNQIKVLFEESWKAYQVNQNLYDEETEHGLIEAAQKKWINNVNEELTTLAEFARD